MSPPRAPLTPRSAVRAFVPALAQWRTFRGTFLNLLTVNVSILASVWVVHQTEYSIEYGRRFGAVMNASPHRSYMAALGLSLAVAVAGLCLAAALGLQAARSYRRRATYLPPRLARLTRVPAWSLPLRAVVLTAIGLAAIQIILYVVQENTESLAASGTTPGLAVLFAPQHRTVVPLHMLAAVCVSILLWSMASFGRASRRTAQMVRALVAMVAARTAATPRRMPLPVRLPSLPLPGGSLCPRAPPSPA